jgi:hypothetical protein
MRCPECGGLPSQGTNYEKLLELAESGKLVCGCARCGITWTPSPTDHKVIAANIRKIMVAVNS